MPAPHALTAARQRHPTPYLPQESILLLEVLGPFPSVASTGLRLRPGFSGCQVRAFTKPQLTHATAVLSVEYKDLKLKVDAANVEDCARTLRSAVEATKQVLGEVERHVEG